MSHLPSDIEHALIDIEWFLGFNDRMAAELLSSALLQDPAYVRALKNIAATLREAYPLTMCRLVVPGLFCACGEGDPPQYCSDRCLAEALEKVK